MDNTSLQCRSPPVGLRIRKSLPKIIPDFSVDAPGFLSLCSTVLWWGSIRPFILLPACKEFCCQPTLVASFCWEGYLKVVTLSIGIQYPLSRNYPRILISGSIILFGDNISVGQVNLHFCNFDTCVSRKYWDQASTSQFWLIYKWIFWNVKSIQ